MGVSQCEEPLVHQQQLTEIRCLVLYFLCRLGTGGVRGGRGAGSRGPGGGPEIGHWTIVQHPPPSRTSSFNSTSSTSSTSSTNSSTSSASSASSTIITSSANRSYASSASSDTSSAGRISSNTSRTNST
jgi:hypothetical protein